MSELMKHATDDQIALAFCFAGVFASGLMMYFSHYLGQKNTQSQTRTQTDDAPLVMPRQVPVYRQDKAA